jgi:hypothetical protein
MNRKITPEQAAHIRHLVKVDHLKLREVAEKYPVIGLAQIHRIAAGTNWQRVTGSPESPVNPSPRKENR